MEFDPVLVHDWLGRSARRTPEKDAIICGGERWSYRKLDASSDRFAEGLIELGMRKQDRVVILTGNCIDTVVSLYGTLKAGGVFVILEANTKARRLSYILTELGSQDRGGPGQSGFHRSGGRRGIRRRSEGHLGRFTHRGQ